MCDCYEHKCELCDAMLQFHIEDFNYPREAFKAWCHRHIEEAPDGAVIFKFKTTNPADGVFRGMKWAVSGPEVGDVGGNCPNTCADYEESIKGEPSNG